MFSQLERCNKAVIVKGVNVPDNTPSGIMSTSKRHDRVRLRQYSFVLSPFVVRACLRSTWISTRFCLCYCQNRLLVVFLDVVYVEDETCSAG